MLRLTLCKMLQGGWNSTNWSCDDLGPLSWGPQNQPPPCHPPPPLHHHHPWHWYVKPYYVLVASCWILTFLTSSCKQDLIQNCLLPIVGFAFLHQNNVLEFWFHFSCWLLLLVNIVIYVYDLFLNKVKKSILRLMMDKIYCSFYHVTCCFLLLATLLKF